MDIRIFLPLELPELMMRKAAIGLGFLVFALSATAGTVIEYANHAGHRNEMLIDAGKARINMNDTDGYVLVDIDEKRIYLVSHRQRSVTDITIMHRETPMLNGGEKGGDAVESVSALNITEQSTGPVIAGQPTVGYRIGSGDRQCFDQYLSVQALEIPDLKRLIGVYPVFDAAPNTPPGGEAEKTVLSCEVAESELAKSYLEHGFPMKVLALPEGKTLMEVVRLQKNVAIPLGTFNYPPGYHLMTIEVRTKGAETSQNTTILLLDEQNAGQIGESLRQSLQEVK